MAVSSYQMAHRRMGRAAEHICPCGRQAYEWAYQYTGDTLYDPSGRAYSDDPKDYLAMCRSCHRVFDEKTAPERFERVRKASAKGTAAVLKKWKTDPEFAARRVSELTGATKRKRKCSQCGFISTTGGLGRHLNNSGHKGYENLPIEQKESSA